MLENGQTNTSSAMANGFGKTNSPGSGEEQQNGLKKIFHENYVKQRHLYKADER